MKDRLVLLLVLVLILLGIVLVQKATLNSAQKAVGTPATTQAK